MKKFTLQFMTTMAIMLSAMALQAQPGSDSNREITSNCIFTISLYDSYGDGWNGGCLDVLVNNVVVLDNITLLSGYGPATYSFNVTDGVAITTLFFPGSWSYECYYSIYDICGNQLWSTPMWSVPPNILPGQLYGYCDPPPAPVVDLGTDLSRCGGYPYFSLDAGNTGCTYLWSTGATTRTITAYTTGTYAVTVTNCTGSDYDEVVVTYFPSAPSFTYEVDCSRDITVTASGGTPPYLYSDDGGLTYQESNVFANEPVGNYNLIVMDVNGCSSYPSTATVADPVMLSSISTPATSGCNGSVTLMPSGGSPPYDYAYLDYPFSGNSLDGSLFDIYNGNFSEGGGSLRADNDVSLNNGWSNSIATSAVYPRTVGDSYEASFKFDADSYVCFGWTNGEALYDKNQIAHGFYTEGGTSIMIKDAAFYGEVAKWITPGTWYDFKIVLTSIGANYYCKESSSSQYNQIWTGTSTQFYPNMGVGATYRINGDNYNGFNTKDWVVNINYAYFYYFYGTSPDPNIFDIYNGNFSVYYEILRADKISGVYNGFINAISTSAVHPRIVGNSFEASFKFDLGSYVCFGWTNGDNYIYDGLEHGFYAHNGTSIRIKEDIYYEDVAMWITPDTWYDFKIVLTSDGANYYCKESSSSVYNQIWTGTSANLSPNMDVGATYCINGDYYSGFNTKGWVVNINQPVSNSLCPGTYNYIVHDAAGCYSTVSANVIGCPMTVEAGLDVTTYFGIASMQQVTRTAVASGGTPPYTYSWSLGRPLLCNQVNGSGDEVFYGGTCSNNTCPESGSPAENAFCSGTETITAVLLDTTSVCVTVTDANGCTATDCFTVNASDVRCFAGNSGAHKIKMCHHTNSNGNPWVEICVDTNSIDAHLAHGDYIGSCDNNKSSDLEAAAETDLHFRLFPNPATNRVTIEFESSAENLYIIELNDLLGRKLIGYQGKAIVGENTREIALAGINRGIYLVKLVMDGKQEMKKIVVE